MQRGVKPEQIILAVPAQECHVEESYDEVEIMQEDLPFIYPDAFEDYSIEEKIQSLIEGMGVTIIKNTKLIEIIEDEEEGLESVLFKMLDIPDEEEEEDDLNIENKSEDQESMGSGAGGTDDRSTEDNKENEAELIKQKKKRKKNEKEIECRVLITAGHKDVD